MPYTIQHNGTTSTASADQTANGSQWVLLGSYDFNGDGSEYIEVSDANGKTVADAIRLTKTAPPPPVSFTTYTVHPDHLGTPQRLTDATGQVVWSASYDPFGRATVNEDPDGDGNTVSFDARFPGQYLDSETGLHYNYFRYYDPESGRYITSDPIGLLGGANTYLYASANPVMQRDYTGLFSIEGAIEEVQEAMFLIGDESGIVGVKDARNIKQCRRQVLRHCRQSCIARSLGIEAATRSGQYGTEKAVERLQDSNLRHLGKSLIKVAGRILTIVTTIDIVQCESECKNDSEVRASLKQCVDDEPFCS